MGKEKTIVISETEIAKLKESKGKPLPQNVIHSFETEFKVDFSDVRVHIGKNAKKITTTLSANAFSHGNHIFFNSGQYNPHTNEGKKLLAHELTHVVQQKQSLNQSDVSEEKNSSLAEKP